MSDLMDEFAAAFERSPRYINTRTGDRGIAIPEDQVERMEKYGLPVTTIELDGGLTVNIVRDYRMPENKLLINAFNDYSFRFDENTRRFGYTNNQRSEDMPEETPSKELPERYQVEPVSNGFIVRVGCGTFVFGTRKELFQAQRDYLNDPAAAEKKYCRSRV